MTEITNGIAPELDLKKPAESPLYLFWHRFRKNKPALVGLVVLILMLAVSLAAPLLTSFDPEEMDLTAALNFPGENDHIFGTDYLGRDILTRLLYGGQLSLTIGFLAVGFGLIFGVSMGAMGGYYGGWIDLVVSRIADILLSFPSFLLALTLVALLGIGTRNVIISVGVLAIPSFIRLVRGSVFSIREMTYVEAARCIGASDSRLIFRHVLPNAMVPVIIQASLNLGYAITTAAGLGFLGLGVQPPTPEWGMMLGEGKTYIFSHPYMVTFPGITIFLAILSLNLIGDGLRDALDPRLRNIG